MWQKINVSGYVDSVRKFELQQPPTPVRQTECIIIRAAMAKYLTSQNETTPHLKCFSLCVMGERETGFPTYFIAFSTYS